MTRPDDDADVDPGAGTDDRSPGPGDGPARRPGTRRDPAAMRETLDAARRRLGPAGPTEGPPQSAATQRALLREAVARSVPLVDEPPHPRPATTPAPATDDEPAARRPDQAGD